MTDEIEGYDEDLKKAIGEVLVSLDNIDEIPDESLSRAIRGLENKLSKIKELYFAFHTEWKELDAADKGLYTKKGDEHKKLIDTITQRLKTYKAKAEKKDFGMKDEDRTTQEYLDEAKAIQKESLASVDRSKNILQDTIAVGTDTLDQMKEDTQKMENTLNELEEIDDELTMASKQIKSIVRKLGRDKCIRVLCIAVCLALLGVMIYLIVKRDQVATSQPVVFIPPPK